MSRVGAVSSQNSVTAVETKPSEPTVPFLKKHPNKQNKPKNQTTPKPGSVPTVKGHRKEQSATTVSEAEKPA